MKTVALFLLFFCQQQPSKTVAVGKIDRAYGIYVYGQQKVDVKKLCENATKCELLEVEGKGYVDIHGKLNLNKGVTEEEFFLYLVGAFQGYAK